MLNIWSTHLFWVGFLQNLGVRPHNIVFSSDTSEEQQKEYGKGRGTVDCCYPVKCLSGHFGELILGQKKKIDILLSPQVYTLPSYLRGHVLNTLTCPRVMAASENIKAGFEREGSVCEEHGITYTDPFVELHDPELAAKQLYDELKDVLDLTREEAQRATDAGFGALKAFDAKMRNETMKVMEWCAREGRPAVLVLSRPYHMDTGLGHEIEVDVQAHGYPILWAQHPPLDEAFLNWIFREELEAGEIKSVFDISDVWGSSYSSNTNENIWAAKFAARCPWITCVIHLVSYECGMDQPTLTPLQSVVEASGTMFFRFGDLDATKPAGSMKIRIQTISHYLEKYSKKTIENKLSWLGDGCPLDVGPVASPPYASGAVRHQDDVPNIEDYDTQDPDAKESTEEDVTCMPTIPAHEFAV